jgi:hypothetical protein
LALLVAASPARADLVYEPGATTDGERLLLVSGVITDTDDIAKFAAAVKRNKAKVIEFDSPGGDIYTAMELGRRIRKLGLDTFQTRGLQCASACSLAFLGGVSRSAAANAIGVHRPYYPIGFPGDVDDAVVATQQATADMIGYIIDMGVDPALVQLSYEYTDMRYLSQDEMKRYRVTTSGTPTPDVREAQAAPAPEQEMPLPATAVFVPPTVKTLYVSPNGASMYIGERATFYEDRTGTAVATIDEGTVTWSVVDASFGADGPVKRVIRAEADIPNRDLRMVMTIYRNDDPRLPDDPIVELVIDTPARSYDTVARLSGFELRDSEQIAGDQIMMRSSGDDGFFLVALAPDERAARTNTDLLKTAQWIDIAMVYKSGRSALFTLKSDLPGDPAFTQLLDAWERPADHVKMRPAQ